MTVLQSRHRFPCAALCLLLALAACEQMTPTDNGGLPFIKDSVIAVPLTGLIPAKLGNTWIYTDSTGTPRDTVRIIGKDTLKGHTFWKVKGYLYGLGDEFAIRNDSIFVMEPTGLGTSYLSCTFIPPPESTATFHYVVGGDLLMTRTAITVRKPITVPAGTYNTYTAYMWEGGLERDSIVFVKGIGIVSRTFTAVSYPSRPGFTLRYALGSYSVGLE